LVWCVLRSRWVRGVSIVFRFVVVTILTPSAIILISVWFVLQCFNGVAVLSTVPQGMGGVGYFAHVGGFVMALVITLVLRPLLQAPGRVSYPYLPSHRNAGDRSAWW